MNIVEQYITSKSRRNIPPDCQISSPQIITSKCGLLHLEACVAPRRGGSDVTLEPPPPTSPAAAEGHYRSEAAWLTAVAGSHPLMRAVVAGPPLSHVTGYPAKA
jgi:hypothetical protein